MYVTHSPWGEVQHQLSISKDIVDVMTESHGGLMIKGEALSRLSDNALEYGISYEDCMCYEEDCAVLIPINELPEVAQAFNYDRQKLESSIQYWYPEYYKLEGMKL